MTGATAVLFRGKRRPERRETVSLTKADNLAERREAERAVRESAVRADLAIRQRGVVARLAASLTEVRQRNNFANGIRAAMLGGDERD